MYHFIKNYVQAASKDPKNHADFFSPSQPLSDLSAYICQH